MPNVLTYKGQGVLQIMDTGEFANLSIMVLEHMASNDGPGVLSTTDGGSYTSIGSLTDTAFQDDIGGSNVTINSNVISIYQDLNTPTGTEPPSVFIYNSSDEPLKITSDEELNDLANSILTWGLTNEGPHSFQLSTSTPSDGGTWSDLGAVTEIYSGSTTNTVNLYKKLSSGSYTLYRPLKSDGQGVIQEFSDTEINYLSKKVRERIVETGIGQYAFQPTVPAEGTWVAKGSITDTRATETSVTFDGSYTKLDLYTGEVPADYTSTFNQPASYTTDLIFQDTGLYTGIGGDAGPAFVGPGTVIYQGPILAYMGPAIPLVPDGGSKYTNTVYESTGFIGYISVQSFSAFYTGETSYIGPPQYDGPGGTYTLAGTAPYLNLPLLQYTTTFLGPVTYNAVSPYVGQAFALGTYTEPAQAEYLRSLGQYSGPGLVSYLSPGPLTYTGPVGNYTRVAYYDAILSYTSVYDGLAPIAYSQEPLYTTTYTGSLIEDFVVTGTTYTLWRRVA